jgi:hypothetical protein
VPTPDGEAERRGGAIAEDDSLREMLAHFTALHGRIVAAFAELPDAALDTPSIWWEGHALPVRFRLHRFDAHLREHTIQVDKTLVGIGHAPTETGRLLRLLHRALGECEAALIGAPDVAEARRRQVEASLHAIATTMERLRLSSA